LNPDTMVRPGALDALLDFARARPDVGIMGSSIEGADGAPWPFAFRFPTLWSELDGGMRLGVVSRLLRRWAILHPMNGQEAQVDWVVGASMMVRREVFESIGLMDEHYFLYYEETDFCLQARRAGWSCWYVPQSRVMHIAGQSTGVTGKQAAPKRRPKYWFDSRRRYFIKNRSRSYAIATDLVWMSAYSLWRVRRVIQRRAQVDPPHFLADFLRYSALATSDIDGNTAVTDRARS
jgi:N-acetylglucosaminyl-diphospho-decaprenol L-rhamnosyltransferase